MVTVSLVLVILFSFPLILYSHLNGKYILAVEVGSCLDLFLVWFLCFFQLLSHSEGMNVALLVMMLADGDTADYYSWELHGCPC